jgi:predicted  nucleic acid-binding Zn-ribbon protein
MIDDLYIDAAVRIRRTYLNLTDKLEDYEKYLNSTVKLIDSTLLEVDKLSKEIEGYKNTKNVSQEEPLMKLLDIINRLESDSKKLEEYINPLNQSIERLRSEEIELYKNIKLRYPNISDSYIIVMVNEKLEKEGLL